MWIKHASAKYGVHERTLRNWCIAKKIGVKIAAGWVISETKLQDLLGRRRPGQKPHA
jgi:hypothetical protein